VTTDSGNIEQRDAIQEIVTRIEDRMQSARVLDRKKKHPRTISAGRRKIVIFAIFLSRFGAANIWKGCSKMRHYQYMQ